MKTVPYSMTPKTIYSVWNNHTFLIERLGDDMHKIDYNFCKLVSEITAKVILWKHEKTRNLDIDIPMTSWWVPLLMRHY